MNVNKYFFRTLALIGCILIVSAMFFKFWNLNIQMGDLKPTVDARVFGSFDTARFSGNFTQFSDRFASIVKYCYIGILITSFLNIIVLFSSASMALEKRKPLHIISVVLSVLIIICAISIFVLNIIFVKTNTITQDNGFKLIPELLTGVYITIMGGFCAGLFGIYAVTYDSK